MSAPRPAIPALPALLRAAGALGPRACAAFAFYAAALALWRGDGLVSAVASAPGLLLLVGGGLALVVGVIGAVLAPEARAPGARVRSLVRVLPALGAGLLLVCVPASLVLRQARTAVVVAGEELAPGLLPGAPAVIVERVTIRPTGPHLLSKTVEARGTTGDGEPVAIGLFPPAPLGPWNASVFRYGYAPAIRWITPDGRVRGEGFVPLGTIPHDEEEASLVEWTPEPNVMMGAGTFPPRLEELVPLEGGAHVFLRLASATLGGARRDLTEPDAYRWMADGPPLAPVFDVRVLRGREILFDAQVVAGGRVVTSAGTLELAPEVPLFVELLATRDPWLPWAGLGLALLGVGIPARLALALGRRVRLRRVRRAAAPGPAAGPRTG